MRVCTRDASNVQYDAAVPVKPKWADPNKMFSDDERCAGTEKDVPWSMDDSNMADPGMFSAGNAPMWRGTIWDDANGVYPDGNRLNEISNTNPGLRNVQEWDPSCSMQDVVTCTQDSDCVSVVPGISMQCLRGICILHRQTTQTCYSHADCTNGKMCAGDGRCIESVLQVRF